MTRRTPSAFALISVPVALLAGVLALSPISQAAPSGDASPPCVADGSCARLIPMTARYLPLTPTSTPTSTQQYAPLAPAPMPK